MTYDESSTDLGQVAVDHHGWNSGSGEELNFAAVYSSRTWSPEQNSGGAFFQHLMETGVLLRK